MRSNDAATVPSGLDLSDFFRAAPCFITVQSRDLRIIAANDLFNQSFGDAEGRHCYHVYKDRDEKCADCPVEQTFTDGQRHTSEQLVKLSDGSEIPIAAYTSPVRGPDGEIVAVVEVSADITPVKKLESRLVDNRKRFRLLFDEIPVYVSVQDRDLHIVQANRMFREDFGDRTGASCYEVYKHRTEECLQCPVAATFRDGKRHHSEEIVTSVDGRKINTLVSTAPIVNPQGQIETVMEMSADITRIRELQGQLTNLGLLIGSISHVLKGLLTGLDGGSYLLNTGLEKGKPERIGKGWAMVQRNMAHVRRVVLDLLYLAGETETHFEPVQIHDLAASVASRLGKRAADLQIDFRVDLDAGVGACEVDARSLEESLLNLLEYCFEACRIDDQDKKHYVRFRLASDGDNAIFEIEDNGAGMDRETRETTFSLFFTAKVSGGTSLGLFTANKVIEKHRGSIDIKSERGCGTSFHIRIPRVRDRGSE